MYTNERCLHYHPYSTMISTTMKTATDSEPTTKRERRRNGLSAPTTIRTNALLLFALVLSSATSVATSRTVTMKEFSGHGCDGDPIREFDVDLDTDKWTSSVLSSFRARCDTYTFKLTFESFFGSTDCEKVCEGSLCYDKSEAFSNWCKDYTYEIGSLKYENSMVAEFDCYSDSWFFYAVLSIGFALFCVCPCVCLYRRCCRRRRRDASLLR